MLQASTQVFSEVAGALSSVPLVGQIVGMVVSVAADIVGQAEAAEARQHQPSAHCLHDERTHRPNLRPDGTTIAAVVPADIFAYKFDGGARRSVLGDVFQRVTEGTRWDPEDFPGAPKGDDLEAVKKALGGWKNYGVPKDRRKRLRAVRRAIQGLYNVPGSDGGATLWPVYLDLIRREFREGRLSPAWCELAWMASILGGKLVISRNDGYGGCYAAQRGVVTQAVSIVNNWGDTVDPVYAQFLADKARLVEMLSTVQAETLRATARALKKTQEQVSKGTRIRIRRMALSPSAARRLLIARRKSHPAALAGSGITLASAAWALWRFLR